MDHLNTVPKLKEVKLGGGEFVINDQTTLLLGKNHTRADKFAAKLLNQEIENLIKTPLQVKVPRVSSNFKNAIILTIPERDREFLKIFKWQAALAGKKLRKEGYIIGVEDEYILIAAASEAGLFYGVQTLRQLLESKEGKIMVPFLWVRDWPEIRYRGIMQDISRGQVLTIDTFKELIRTLSYFKINLLSLYIEHTFVFEKHPLIGQDCGSLTREEVKELDKYARDYHIELVPSFQALGHLYQILKHKEYAHLAETESRWSLSPAEEESYKFLQELFSEIVPAFSSKFFNIGCDEVMDLGEGKSKKMAQELGKGGLYLSHILKVKRVLDDYGRTTMLWGDMLLHHPEVIPNLPKDIIIMNWHYGTDKLEGSDYYRPLIEVFQKAGLQQFACPGTSSWLRLFPDICIANRNIKCFISEAKKFGVEGVLTTNWGDNGNYNLLGYVWYGFAFSAETCWNPNKTEERSFDRRFCSRFFGPNTEPIAQAIWLLSQSSSIISIDLPPEYPSWPHLLFWDDPFEGKYSVNVKDPLETGRKLTIISNSASEIISDNQEKVTKNKKWLDDLFFAAREIGYLGKRLLFIEEAKNLYHQAYANLGDEKVVTECLKKILALLKQLRSDLLQLKEKYQNLWLKENRRPGLDYNLERCTLLIESFDRKISELEIIKKGYDKPGGSLPAPDKINLSKRGYAPFSF